ncbi:hypothetical protein BIZ37_13330 [Photobacterium sp. BZF1]|uniref:hypothetical protein n=1 Tax=Photobacterium sp. BZF1 TaxID=1904457 RepID=UPI001653620C|nr:hypothetical protein [Photobacterium sp. BZF1]MBC7003542.1 hypothetical protein [Photobacterium sp. BZF1]
MSFIKNYLVSMLLCFPLSVFACAYHIGGESEDGPILPGSTDLVFNTFYAQQKGSIDTLEPLEGMQGYFRVSWWLNLLFQQLENAGIHNAYVVIADVQLWSKMGEKTQFNRGIDIEAPEDRSNTIMLSEAALSALVTETIDIPQAINLGLLRVYQDNLGFTGKLLQSRHHS